jgi:hypothetical protein
MNINGAWGLGHAYPFRHTPESARSPPALCNQALAARLMRWACRSLSETLGRHTSFLGGSWPASPPRARFALASARASERRSLHRVRIEPTATLTVDLAGLLAGREVVTGMATASWRLGTPAGRGAFAQAVRALRPVTTPSSAASARALWKVVFP